MATVRARVKDLLKRCRVAVGGGDYVEALACAEGAVALDSGNCMALVLLGLALQHNSRLGDSERAYRQALDAVGKNVGSGTDVASTTDTRVLALQGLEKLYLDPAWPADDGTKRRWTALVDEVWMSGSGGLCHYYGERGDGRKWTDAMCGAAILLHSMLDRSADAVQVWTLLVTSQLADWPANVSPAIMTGAAATIGRLDAMLRLLGLREELLRAAVQREINVRRYRLGAPPLSVIKGQVEGELFGQSDLGHLFDAVLVQCTSENESARQFVLIRYLKFIRSRLAALTGTEKTECRDVLDLIVSQLDESSILTDIDVADFAWENRDALLDEYDMALADQIVAKYPKDSLAVSINAYRNQWKDNGDVNLCIETLKDCLKTDRSHSLFGWMCLSEGQLAVGDYNGALVAAMRGKAVADTKARDECFRGEKATKHFDVVCAKCYVEGDKSEIGKGVAIFRQVLQNDRDNVVAWKGLARAFERQCAYAECIKCLDKVMQLDQQDHRMHFTKAWMLFQSGEVATALDKLEAAIGQFSTEVLYLDHYRLGRVRWAIDGPYKLHRDYALAAFLKAAQLNPDFAETFLYLGHYYHAIGDNSRATKCYQRAFDLNSAMPEVGAMLVDLYESSGDFLAAYSVYRVVANREPRAHWAWKKLGQYNLLHRDYGQAISCLQSALRCNVTDPVAWRSLADAYREEGRYASALKAYDKVQLLQPGDYECVRMSGKIRYKLGAYEEAVKLFKRSLIAISEDSAKDLQTVKLEVLYDLALAHRANARRLTKAGYYGRSADSLTQALESVLTALELQSRNSKFWLLAGKIMRDWRNAETYLILFPAKVGESIIEISTRQILGRLPLNHYLLSFRDYEEEFLSVMDTKKLDSFAVKCIKCALICFEGGGASSTVDMWTALSYCYQSLARTTGDTAYLNSAVKSWRIALSLDPEDARLWNTFGCLVAPVNKNLCRLAFYKSIELDDNAALAWVNLALLFIMENDVEAARACCAKAQIIDPEHSTAWFVQWVVAAATQSAVESRGILQHAFHLDDCVTADVSFAYAEMVYRERLSGANKLSLDPAIFALRKTVESHPKCPQSLNLLALCLECEGLYSEAVSYLKQAKSLLSAYLTNVAIEKNLARVLCAAGLFSESANLYEQMDSSKMTSDSLFGRSAALYSLGRVEDSLVAIMRVLEATAGSRDEIGVTVAACHIFCSLPVNEGEAIAIQRLLKCFQTYPADLSTIVQLLYMGVGTKNEALSAAAFAEVQKLSWDVTSNSGLSSHVNTLAAFYWRNKNQHKKSIAYLERSVRNYPYDANSWSALSQHLHSCSFFGAHLKAACKSAILLNQTYSHLDPKQTSTAHCYSILAECMYRTEINLGNSPGDTLNHLAKMRRLASAAVHSNPGSRDNWRHLLDQTRHALEYGIYLHVHQFRRDSGADAKQLLALVDFYLGFVDHAYRNQTQIDFQLARADADFLRAIIFSLMGKAQESANILDDLLCLLCMEEFEDNAAANVLLSRVYQLQGEYEKSIGSLKAAIAATDEMNPARIWEELGTVYEIARDFESSEYCLSHALQIITDAGHKFSLYLRKCCLAIQGNDVQAAAENINQALQIQPSSTVARLIQGVCTLLQGNHSKAVKLLRSGLGDEEDAITSGSVRLLPGQAKWLAEALSKKDREKAAFWLEQEKLQRQ